MQTAKDETPKEPAGSSLVNDAEEEEGEAEQVETDKVGVATDADKKTQELIDEMLAEEQQSMMQSQEEDRE